MALRNILIAGGVLGALACGSLAIAQDIGAEGVAFTDPQQALEQQRTVQLSLEEGAGARFAQPQTAQAETLEGPRQFELEFAASADRAGVPLDVSVARRQSLGANADGDIERQGAGSEVRIGRGLVQQRQGEGERSSVYMFVASDDEALTWRPGQRNEFGAQNGGGFQLQDQVEVGDVSAGITYERNGVQASLAYVEREVSTQVGRDSYSQNETFTGVTVTMRR